MSVCYEIRIQGDLDPRWSYYFEGLDVSLLPTGETVLSGPLPDQAALHAILSRIRDLGLPLLLVSRLPSTLEQAGQGVNGEEAQEEGGKENEGERGMI